MAAFFHTFSIEDLKTKKSLFEEPKEPKPEKEVIIQP
jgi:hypothetical protein